MPTTPPRSAPPRLALVGDRSPSVQAHARIPAILDTLGIGAGDPIEPYWMASTSLTTPADVAGFDGIWVVPGSPYTNRDGVLIAIEAARTGAVPLLGTCGGFQHIVLEFARNVCGLARAEHAEEYPDAEELVIVPLECSLVGEEANVVVEAGSLAARVMGAGPRAERFFCRYGLDPAFASVLAERGLVVTGRDDGGDARIVELPGHPFFVGSLFQPELSSDATFIHPLIAAFAAAVRARATAPGLVGAVE